MRRVLFASVALGVALVLGGCAGSPTVQAGGGSNGATGITAHGTGTATGAPDEVTIVLGVQTQANNAGAAMTANAQQANNVINTLKEKGVADADIQTSQLSVNPSYDPSGGRIIGYQVTNQVTVTLHKIDGSGAIIDAAGKAAGDAIRVQQLSFSIADDSKLREKARADAVTKAKAQAEQMADAAGVRLGKVLSITENPTATPPSPLYRRSLDDAAGSTPVQPGTSTLTVSVDIVYDILQ